MPSKKDVFIDLLNLLKTNISSVSNRVYSSYPKKNITFPFIVISDIRRSQRTVNLSNDVFTENFLVEVTVYTKTTQECDELSDQIYTLLKSTKIQGKKPNNIEEIDSDQVIEANGKIYHFKTLSLLYVY
ncbi:MAG: hypothetical protein DRN17_00430 [Thermoplasmata archaeon]|nr:MAG: hypothetical protein DRN17_00430 [Thermoplasmata archaeon]